MTTVGITELVFCYTMDKTLSPDIGYTKSVHGVVITTYLKLKQPGAVTIPFLCQAFIHQVKSLVCTFEYVYHTWRIVCLKRVWRYGDMTSPFMKNSGLIHFMKYQIKALLSHLMCYLME